MRVENATRWSTAHITRIASEVVRREKLESAASRLVVNVQTRPDPRLPRAIGYAYVGSMKDPEYRIWIVMPEVPTRTGNGDPVLLAHTIAHELAHCRGLEHADMAGRPEYAHLPGWRDVYRWAALYPLVWVPTSRHRMPGTSFNESITTRRCFA